MKRLSILLAAALVMVLLNSCKNKKNDLSYDYKVEASSEINFADNTTIVTVTSWCAQNDMKYNPEGTALLIYSATQNMTACETLKVENYPFNGKCTFTLNQSQRPFDKTYWYFIELQAPFSAPFRSNTLEMPIHNQKIDITGIMFVEGVSGYMAVNESKTLHIAFTPSDNSDDIQFETSNPNVIDIQSYDTTSCVIVAKAVGNCVVTAKCSHSTIAANLSINVIGTKEEVMAFTVKGTNFKMIRVEGGTFQMGSGTESSHSVTLSEYYIGETEVTQELWTAVMNTCPSNFSGANQPVACVSWDDCQIFIKKLNQITGLTFAMPTEAQWQFAAKGGNKSQAYIYSGSNTANDVAWYIDNSSNCPHQVGTKRANELGIYDMSGNIYEFCADYSGDYSVTPQFDPTGPTDGYYRIMCGGNWYYRADKCLNTNRDAINPTFADHGFGLRLALPLWFH